MMKRFDQLPLEQRLGFNACLEAYGCVIEARCAVMEALAPGSSRSATKLHGRMDMEKEVLINMCAALMVISLEGRSGGEPGIFDWYADFHKAMPIEDRSAWEEFNQVLLEDVPIFLGLEPV